MKRMRDTPNTSANGACARPLPAGTTPQARTVPGLRLAGCAAWPLAGVMPGTALGTATATANLLTAGAIYAARCARRPTGATAPAARTVPELRLASRAAVRVPEVARTATLTGRRRFAPRPAAGNACVAAAQHARSQVASPAANANAGCCAHSARRCTCVEHEATVCEARAAVSNPVHSATTFI